MVNRGVHVGSDSGGELHNVRSQARRLGLSIRTQRASRGSDVRTFAIVDRETGTVVDAGLQDLSDIQARLWWIVHRRRTALSGLPPTGDVPEELCPSCGTRRASFFRWCLSCGRDYEAGREPTLHMAPRPRWNGRTGRLYERRLPEPRLVLDKTPGRRSIVSRLAARAYEVNDGYPLGLVRQIVGGAVVAMVVAAMVVLLVLATK